jgi:hypothetical protein
MFVDVEENNPYLTDIILLYGSLISNNVNNQKYSYRLSINSIAPIREKIDSFNSFNIIIISNNPLKSSTESFVANFNNEINNYKTSNHQLEPKDYWENILHKTILNLLNIYKGINLIVTVSFATIDKTINIEFTNEITVSNSN